MSKIASDNEVRKWKPEGLDLSAGPVPVFPIYIFTETRELQHLETGASCEPRSAKDLRQLNYFRKEVFLVNPETSSRSFSSERRCSSRTFRYGYLVTT